MFIFNVVTALLLTFTLHCC